MCEYLTNCTLNYKERNADYDWRNKICSRFEVYKNNDYHLCSNISNYFNIHKDKKITWDDGRWNSDKIYLYQAIPSALLLYRLACMFDANIELCGESGYKCVWMFFLKHNNTGEIIAFGEHKGAADVWSKFTALKSVPKSLKRDLLDFVQYLISDVCAHPYDGLVAGGVA